MTWEGQRTKAPFLKLKVKNQGMRKEGEWGGGEKGLEGFTARNEELWGMPKGGCSLRWR